MSELQKQLLDPPDDSELKAERVQGAEEERAAVHAVADLASRWEAMVEAMAPSTEATATPALMELGEAQNEALVHRERVLERLQKMPGWSLAVGGHAIDRVRDLPSAFGAADYGTLVLREAARTRQKVRVGLTGSRLVVSVMAPPHGRQRGLIGKEQLDFAAGLV